MMDLSAMSQSAEVITKSCRLFNTVADIAGRRSCNSTSFPAKLSPLLPIGQIQMTRMISTMILDHCHPHGYVDWPALRSPLMLAQVMSFKEFLCSCQPRLRMEALRRSRKRRSTPIAMK